MWSLKGDTDASILDGVKIVDLNFPHYFPLLYATLRYSTLLYATLRYSMLLYATQRYATLRKKLSIKNGASQSFVWFTRL
jgi:hypothetical protein